MNIYVILGFPKSLLSHIREAVIECNGICSLFEVDEILSEKNLGAYVLPPAFALEENLKSHQPADTIALPLDFHVGRELIECLESCVQETEVETMMDFDFFVRRQYRATPVLILKVQDDELRAGLLSEY